MKPKPDVKRTRVQLDFTDEAINELNELIELTGSASRAEAVRRAIKLTNVLLREMQESKKKILLEDQAGGKTQIVLL